jgi:predicted TIM-barrel fold metal-dependent hydrolase
MTDSHIHIGQFYEVYYKPLEIIEIITDAGVDNAVYTSSTSCKENVQYSEVEKEIALVTAQYPADKIQPFLWYVPEYAMQGISVEKAMDSSPYKGLKIHPRANTWNLEDRKTLSIACELFDYADKHKLPIIIHTGYDPLDEANKFSRFFGEYKNTKIILAHCRPIDQTLALLRKYNNVYCDTAFVEESTVQNIIKAGFAERIHTGSDFPVTHYYKTTYLRNGENPNITLREKYTEDSTLLKHYSDLAYGIDF